MNTPPTGKALPPPPPLPPPKQNKSSPPLTPPQVQESSPLPPLPPPPQPILYVKSFLEDFSYTDDGDRRLPVSDPESLTWYTLLKLGKGIFTMVEDDAHGSPRYTCGDATATTLEELAHMIGVATPVVSPSLEAALTDFQDIINRLIENPENEDDEMSVFIQSCCNIISNQLGPKTYLLADEGSSANSKLSIFDAILVSYAMIICSELTNTKAWNIFHKYTNLVLTVDRFFTKVKTPLVLEFNEEETNALIAFAVDTRACRALGAGGYGRVTVGRVEEGNLWRLVPVEYAFKVTHVGQEWSYEAEKLYLKMLRYRNIVKLYGCGESKGKTILVLSCAQGGSLRSAIDDFNYPELLKFFKGFAVGLHSIHAHLEQVSLIHHDVKPENVLLDHEKNAIIVDFGMMKGQMDKVSVTHTIYAKPPCIHDPNFDQDMKMWSYRKASTRDDTHALGIILLETATTVRIDPLGPMRYDTYWNLKNDVAAPDFEFETLIKPRIRNTGCTRNQARDIVVLAMDCLSCIEDENAPLAHQIADRLQELIDQLSI